MSRSLSYKSFLPGIAWFFLVNFLCCLPGSDLPPVEDWLSKIYFDKWVHVGLFGVLAFLVLFPVVRSSLGFDRKARLILYVALAVSAWGLCIEFIQREFIPGRSFDLFDWMADSIGAAAAFVWARIRLKAHRS